MPKLLLSFILWFLSSETDPSPDTSFPRQRRRLADAAEAPFRAKGPDFHLPALGRSKVLQVQKLSPRERGIGVNGSLLPSDSPGCSNSPWSDRSGKQNSSRRIWEKRVLTVTAFLLCFTPSGCKWTSMALPINLHFSAQVQGARYLPMTNLFENKEL